MFLSCKVEGTTETPAPVPQDSIRLLDDPPLSVVNFEASEYQVSFGVAWDPPIERYGAEEYEVYVGGRPINEDIDNEFHPTTEVSWLLFSALALYTHMDTQQGNTSITIEQIIELTNPQEIYIQVTIQINFIN